MEISSGGHGKEVWLKNSCFLFNCISVSLIQTIDILGDFEKQKFNSNIVSKCPQKHELLEPNKECERSLSEQFVDIWTLVRRSAVVQIRNPILIWLRLLGLVFSLGGKFVIYSKISSGAADGGCTDASEVFQKIRSIASNEGSVQKNFKNLQNVSYIITLTMFVHFCCICPTLMTFPIELASFIKVIIPR